MNSNDLDGLRRVWRGLSSFQKLKIIWVMVCVRFKLWEILPALVLGTMIWTISFVEVSRYSPGLAVRLALLWGSLSVAGNYLRATRLHMQPTTQALISGVVCLAALTVFHSVVSTQAVLLAVAIGTATGQLTSVLLSLVVSRQFIYGRS